MSRKSVTLKRLEKPASAEAWINQVREETALRTPAGKKPTVRFTLDVDTDLHTRMKIECVRQGKKMSDVLRTILAREFPAV
jgi:hypothetical protein